MKKLNYLSLLKYKFSAIILLICCYSCSENGINIIEPPEPPNVCLICPSITSVSPSEGYEGDTIVITGNNLGGATKVLFNNDLEATILGTSTDNEVKVKVPNVNASTPDTVLINVQKLDGKGALLNTNKKGNFRYLNPSISSFSPNKAFIGDTVEVHGNKLSHVNSLFFNDKEAKLFMINNRFYIKIPPKSTNSTVLIAATQNNGKPVLVKPEATFDFLFEVIDRFTPVEGEPNTIVTLYGSFMKYAQPPVVKVGSTSCNVISYNRDSIVIVIPKGSQSSTINLVTTNGNIQSKQTFYYNPKTLSAILVNSLPLPNQNRLDANAFRLKASKTHVYALIYDQDSLASKYLVYRKNPVQGIPGSLRLSLETSKRLNSSDPDLAVTFNLAISSDFSYIIRGAFPIPFNKNSPNIPKFISRIDKSGSLIDKFYKLTKPTDLFDALDDNSLIVGPSEGGFIQKFSGTNTIFDYDAGKFELDKQVQSAGISSALDVSVFYIGGKINTISHLLNNQKVIFSNVNYSIRNLTVNSSTNLDRIYFQDGNMQRIIMYNVITKTLKIYSITGDGIEFNRICIDDDGILYGINSKGIYKIVEP